MVLPDYYYIIIMFIIIILFLLCLACCCLPNDVSSSAQIFDAFIFAVRAIVPLNVFLVLMISKLPDASFILSRCCIGPQLAHHRICSAKIS